MTRKFLIDFDSTLVKLESLEVLAETALAGALDKTEHLEAIAGLTEQAMNGDLSFSEVAGALHRRFILLRANRFHIASAVKQLQDNISDSFLSNRDFLRREADRIFIVSSGFGDLIRPVVSELQLHIHHVYANDFVFDDYGNIIGYDTTNPLASEGGKIKVARQLAGNDELIVIGDGWNDYQVEVAGVAQRFYLFTENAIRPRVTQKVKRIAPSLDTVLVDCGFKP